MKHNNLVINKAITEYILIDLPNMCTDNLILNADSFEEFLEFLGTIIDQHLKFDDLMLLNILLMLHEQLCLSKIRYCLIVIGSSGKTTKRRLSRLHKILTKIIFSKECHSLDIKSYKAKHFLNLQV